MSTKSEKAVAVAEHAAQLAETCTVEQLLDLAIAAAAGFSHGHCYGPARVERDGDLWRLEFYGGSYTGRTLHHAAARLVAELQVELEAAAARAAEQRAKLLAARPSEWEAARGNGPKG